MPAANDLRKGMAIKYNGNPAIVLEVHHRTPGNLRAFVQAIIRYINTGKSADRLLSVDSPIAAEAQLHEHVMQGDLMKMQQVPSVEIPAGGTVTFAPMAYHVMLLNPSDRSLLSDGKRFPMTLHFQKAGDVSVEVAVQKKAPESAQGHVHAQ